MAAIQRDRFDLRDAEFAVPRCSQRFVGVAVNRFVANPAYRQMAAPSPLLSLESDTLPRQFPAAPREQRARPIAHYASRPKSRADARGRGTRRFHSRRPRTAPSWSRADEVLPVSRCNRCESTAGPRNLSVICRLARGTHRTPSFGCFSSSIVFATESSTCSFIRIATNARTPFGSRGPRSSRKSLRAWPSVQCVIVCRLNLG